MSIHPAFAPISLRATFPHRGAQCSSSGQNLAAAGATGLQNIAAGAGLHAGTEAVALGTLTSVRLIGALHIVSLSWFRATC